MSPTRDAEAAKRFFLKALHSSASLPPGVGTIEEMVAHRGLPANDTTNRPTPRVINVDKNAASPKAFNELKAEGFIPPNCELRQVKYLNNLIEQDHRFIKRKEAHPGLLFV